MIPFGIGIGGEQAVNFANGRSLSFDGSDDWIAWTSVSDMNRQTWTLNLWFKLSVTGQYHTILSGFYNGTNGINIFIHSDGKLYFESGGTIGAFNTTNSIADTDWHQLTVRVDSTQATQSDRLRFYLDGSPMEGTYSYPSQDAQGWWWDPSDPYRFGANAGDASWKLVGLLDEIALCNGQSYGPESFASDGKPIDIADLTFGTGGFWIRFEDNSSTTTLGEDSSGNNNDWTLNGMTTGNSSTTVP